MLIGLMGLAGTGKSTVGRILRDEYGFVPIAFADSLKDGVAVLFNWPRHLLEGDTDESRAFRETPDPYWSEAFGKPITPRYVLQYTGTELFRNWLADFWVRAAGKKMADDPTKNYVITDMRFVNEFEFVSAQKGFLVQIQGANEPSWVQSVISETVTEMDSRPKQNAQYWKKWADVQLDARMRELGVHRSEWEHVSWRAVNSVDFVLYNVYDSPSESSRQNLSASVQHMIRVFQGPRDEKTAKNKALDLIF